MHGWMLSGFSGWLSKILNFTDFDSFSDLFSVCLRTIYHLILKLIRYIIYLLHVLRFWISKIQDFRIFEFSPMQMLYQLLYHQPVKWCNVFNSCWWKLVWILISWLTLIYTVFKNGYRILIKSDVLSVLIWSNTVWALTRKNPSLEACQQQRHWPACASYSLISASVIGLLESIISKLATSKISIL